MKKLNSESKVKMQKANYGEVISGRGSVAGSLLTVMIFLFAVQCSLITVSAQSNEFTYQGRLLDNSLPPTANYDFQFSLWDALANGTQQGTTQTVTGVAVANGIFTVRLNFGAQFTGAPRFLQIAVQPAGGTTYVPLAPRQPITSGPYAIRSANAGNADNATNATTANNALNLGGVAANQYVVTTDPRMTDARDPLPNSTNYIQNRTTQQALSNFNVSGNGTAGGTLSGNVLNATTQYNIGGNRILGNPGTDNLFAGSGAGFFNSTGFSNSFFGSGAGFNNTTGNNNAFFGDAAGVTNSTGNNNAFFGGASGRANTTGAENAFFGGFAGALNTTGGSNAFFGRSAGQSNTGGNLNAFFGANAGSSSTTGTQNAFFGTGAGNANTTGSNNVFLGISAGNANMTGVSNTIIGALANVGSNNLNFATAIGAGSVVSASNTIALGRSGGQDSVVIPGMLAANGSGLTNLNANNITSGTLAIANGGTGSSTQNFVDLSTNQTGIGGDKTFTGTLSGNAVNATTQFNIGGSRILSNAGTNNLFAGAFAGFFNSTGFSNSFVGSGAGFNNTTGNNNSFFGDSAGAANSTGNNNAFFGKGAGQSTTTSSEGAFFGAFTGFSNTTGVSNAFFGRSAGQSNTGGNLNAFFGSNAGFANTTGTQNAFLGMGAGNLNTTGGNNVFVGITAGSANTTGINNTIIGALANVGSNNLTNATAIGANAHVSQSNSIVIGSINGVNGATADTRVGIGTSAPGFKLEIVDSGTVGIRVVTNTSGGSVASFGSNGRFEVDAPFIPGGRLAIDESGNTRIGTNIIGHKLAVGGTVYIEGNVTLNSLGASGNEGLCRNASNEIGQCSSSRRYKQNINSFNSGLSLIKQLRPVSFNWKQGGKADLGLVAEDVAEVEPLLTTFNDKGEVEGVKYDRIGVLTVNAIKEQQEVISSQQAAITELKQQIKIQQTQIDALKKFVCVQNPTAEICKEEK